MYSNGRMFCTVQKILKDTESKSTRIHQFNVCTKSIKNGRSTSSVLVTESRHGEVLSGMSSNQLSHHPILL